MLGAVADQLQLRVDRLLGIVKTLGPEAAADGHCILRGQLLLAKGPVPQALPHEADQLIGDPIHAFLIKDADPGAHRPLHGGIADQVVILDHLEQMEEGLRPSRVHGLADRLPGPLLEPGC